MKFIAAWVDGHQTFYRDAAGEEWVRNGGSIAWRNNNPGNIRDGSLFGAIGHGAGFAIFPDEATGFEAILDLLRTKSYRDLSLKDAIYRCAPPNDNNDSDAYVKAVAKQMGVADSTILHTLTDAQLNTMASAIQTHEGWKPGKEHAVRAAKPKEAFAEVAFVAGADKGHIPDLIANGKNAETLHEAQDTAAKSMKADGYGYTLHKACAATLSALLNMSGISIKTELNAGRLAKALKDRGWEHIDVGSQQAGDVAVAKGNVHIFLVVEARGDRMLIADNQKPTAHTRYASGKGKTPVDYFLRAVTATPEMLAALVKADEGFFPSEDEPTDDL